MKSDDTLSELCIRIADVTISMASGDPGLKLRTEGDVNRFAVPAASPDLAMRAYWDDLSRGKAAETAFDSGGVWRLSVSRDFYWFHFTTPKHGRIPYKVARINRDFASGEVFLHRSFFNPDHPVYPLQYPLDEILVLNLLSRRRGVEVHGCGVVDANGDGYLFTGQSGAGKTTMARLWEGEDNAVILSDDRIILRQEQGRIWMYGTPWHGEAHLSCSARAQVKSVFFLQHGTRNMLRAKTGADAAALLFARSFPVFYDPEGLQFTLEFFDRLTRTVPCLEFSVVPDHKAVDFVRKHQRSQAILV